MVKPRQKGFRDGLIRLALWGTIGLVLLIGYLDMHPVDLDAEEHFEPGTSMVLDSVSDVLLVVDYEKFPVSASGFDELDFSLAWLNTLQQEIGPIALTDAEKLPAIELSDYRIVVLSRSASGNEEWLPKLKGFADRGGVLVLELPEGSIRETFSADGKGGLRDPQRITPTGTMPPEIIVALQDLPLHTRLMGSSGPLEGAETLFTIDGVPVIYRKKFGNGWVITFDFDFGMLLTALQQGRPSEGFRLRNRRGSDLIETADLVDEDFMLESEVPIADLLERVIVYGAISPSYPIVGFWPFIDGLDGAFVVTHDERAMGDQATWMAEYEHGFEGTSTYLLRLPGTFTAEGAARLTELGVDVGLEWNHRYGDGGAFRPLGLWGVEPFQRALALVDQADLARELLENLPPLVTVRMRDHIWGRDWVEPLRALAAIEVRADASYAPLPGAAAYAFGTGLPFMPLDSTGLAFNLLEFPTVLLATGEEGEKEAIATLLKASEESAHQAIGVSFAPSAFIETPSAQLYATWRDSYRIAAEHGHWITSVRNLYRFTRARHNSELRSRRVETVVDGREVLLLRIETLALESGMHCSVPKQIGERAFADARRGVNRVQGDQLLAEKLTARPVNVMGFERLLLPLSKGFNAIDVVYQ